MSLEQTTRRARRAMLDPSPRRFALGLAAALVLALSATALAAGGSIHVRPHRVEAGHLVRIRGSTGGCPQGERVTLLSKAFPHRHEFAGVPAVYTQVRSGGKFHRRVRIPEHRNPRRYSVTGRCSGGNFAFTHFRVVRHR
jgi:hypothetical protein